MEKEWESDSDSDTESESERKSCFICCAELKSRRTEEEQMS